MKIAIELTEDDMREAVVMLLRERGYEALSGQVCFGHDGADSFSAKVADVVVSAKRGKKGGE